MVAGRHRGLRRQAERVPGARARARRDLPGRQPRSRRLRRTRHRPVHLRRGRRGPLDAHRALSRGTRVPRRALAQGRAGRHLAVPRIDSRSRVGVRPDRRRSGSLAQGAVHGPRPRRPQPCAARPRIDQGRASRAARPSPIRTSRWAASSCSTRARSASPATATRAPRGCCSTPTPASPASCAASTTSTARRRTSAKPASRSVSPTVSRAVCECCSRRRARWSCWAA